MVRCEQGLYTSISLSQAKCFFVCSSFFYPAIHFSFTECSSIIDFLYLNNTPLFQSTCIYESFILDLIYCTDFLSTHFHCIQLFFPCHTSHSCITVDRSILFNIFVLATGYIIIFPSISSPLVNILQE